ncbi:MAG: PAS domain S-box protein [Desulfobaccales bacterium]
MTRKLGDQPLDLLEQRFQALRDQAGGLSGNCRPELETALLEVSQAIAAVREARQAETGPQQDPPDAPEPPASPASRDLTVLIPPESPDRMPPGYQPEDTSYCCDTILRHVFSAIPDLLTVIDRDFNIIMTNWHDSGVVPEEARRGRPKCYRVYHHRDRPCQNCHVQKVFATGQPQKAEKINVLDGRTREFSAFPVLSESGQVILGAEHVRDVTEPRLAEEALKESEATLRTLIAANPESLILMDTRGMVLAASKVAAQRFETSLEEIIGADAFALVPTEVGRKRSEIFQQVVASGAPARFEDVRGDFYLDISMTPIFDQDKVVQVAVLAVDITARKQGEKALRESEERFKFLFEYAPDAYFLMDLQGNFLDANRAAERLSGYRQEELIGQNFQTLPLLDDRQKTLVTELLALSVYGEVVGPVDLTLSRKDGREVIIEVKGLPLEMKRQSLVLAVARDITDRKQAEEALRESEERYRTLFETSPDALIVMDLDMNIIMGNQRALEMVGHDSLEQFMSRKGINDMASEDRPRVAAAIKALLATGRTQTFETTMVKQDGARFPSLNSAALIRDAAGRPRAIIGTARDITALKQAEAALRESEQRFRDITEHAAEWVWETDAQGTYTYSSPVVEQLLGYKPEEVLGKYFYDFFLPGQREKLKNAALTVFAAKQPFGEFLSPNLHKNGRIVWLSTSGIPILDDRGDLLGYRGAKIDITERREAEALSRNLIANSPVGIYLIQNRKFQLVNQWFFTITGYGEGEFLSLRPLDLVHPEDREATKENAVKMLKGLSSVPYEYRTITKGGEIKWIMETLAAIRYKGKGAVLGYFMDITERKALEQQLIQAQKMEAVGRLAGGVAHDFNNLLMAIMGYGELMRSKVLKGDPLYDHLENILKAGDRAAALTQQLLTFSRRQIVSPQVVDLNRVVLDLEPMLRRLIGEDLDLEITTDPGPVAVKADPGQLGQIIMNLVVNARDAMPRGGRLTLKAASVEFKQARHTRFGQVPPGSYVRLVVRDTGVGMDEATQAHVFEPFFTTKEPDKGTGLGLSTVYGIVKQSGGYLDLASEPGAGSTFTIWLSRLETLVEPPKTRIPLTASYRGKETILLVEDEDVLRGLLAKFLRLYGYTVLEARHGGEALLICERRQEPIHLMVTDVVMPQMSGRELADRLTPLRPDMKVLYMSGYTEDAVVQHGVEDLSVAFLQKPFKPIDLARKVYAILHAPVRR